MSAPVLAFPCSGEEFVVDCDASDYGLGAVISQWQDEDEKVLASWVLDNHKHRYITTQEMLAMMYSILFIPPLPVRETLRC